MHEKLKGSAALQAADIPSHLYPGLAAWAKEEPALRALRIPRFMEIKNKAGKAALGQRES